MSPHERDAVRSGQPGRRGRVASCARGAGLCCDGRRTQRGRASVPRRPGMGREPVRWLVRRRFLVRHHVGRAPTDDRGIAGRARAVVPVDLHRERSAIAKLGRVLASAGASAVRVEQSKAGYAIERWLELVDGSDPWTLYRAAVVVLVGKDEVTSCGMHVFSFADAQIRLDAQTDARAANQLLAALNVYQIAEDPLLLSGHTFSPDRDNPKRVLHRWPDATYEPGHMCHNPFGIWRLGA